MSSEKVLKVAHNMAHDWRQIEKIYGVPVRRPWFDTIGGAHVLQPTGGRKAKAEPWENPKVGSQIVGKALSPHLSAQYTGWPFHKWLSGVDGLAYCGMDTVVAYDAYWPLIGALHRQPKKLEICEQSHRLFEPLFRASSHGVLIDEDARAEVEREYQDRLDRMARGLRKEVSGQLEEALSEGRLEKPHLFREWRTCQCCRNGSGKRQKCWSCVGFDQAPSKGQLEKRFGPAHPGELKADLEERVLGPCQECNGQGGQEEDKPLNLQSPDQIKDLFYKAYRIPARRYQGSITTRFDQLARLLEPGAYLGPGCPQARRPARAAMEKYVALARLDSQLDTIKRLTPGLDGRLRTTFDPWYTPTYRIASREGLLDVGTNLQNIPKYGRKFVVPDPGQCFLYPDYAQIEGRSQAVLTGDEGLLEIYRSGKNSHREVMRIVKEATGLEITYDQAKRVAFASFYDIEEQHLADILGVQVLQAKKVLRAFFQAFPKTLAYKEKVEVELRAGKSCTAPTGWVRPWLGYVMETDGRRKGQVKRKIRKEALASGPQHMAAWVMAEGLLALWDTAGVGNPALDPADQWLLIQVHVHDSALIGVDLDRVQEAIPLVESVMEIEVEDWEMTFPVEAVLGPDWYGASLGDAKKADKGYDGWQRDRVLADGPPGR